MGNPYCFADARNLGLHGEAELFGAGEDVFARMLEVRTAATALLKWPLDSVFPKIAAVSCYQPGQLAVRATAATAAGVSDTLHWVSVSRKLAELDQPIRIASLADYDYRGQLRA